MTIHISHGIRLTLSLMLASGVWPCFSQSHPAREFKDVVYATVDGKQLALDLFLPAGVPSPGLFVWVHGGAWRSGTKEKIPPEFINNGFAVASLDFRQSIEARFPAPIQDIKAAIRFLRAKSGEYGYQAERIVIGGNSSGGHLAALVGVTNGSAVLEGTIGDYLRVSSDVQGIVDYYGASDLMTILSQSTPHGLSVRQPALELLLGALPEEVPELARLASPVTHVDRTDPPLLLIHGDQDPQMPINQAHELEGKYQELNLDVYFDVVHGGAHGGEIFYTGEHLKRMWAFLHRILD